MNPVVIVYLLAAALTIALARPLVQRRVKMNDWYGVRIPAAFASEEAWFDINAYGGRLLARWGWGILGLAVIGVGFSRKYWVAYNVVSAILIIGGLVWVMAKIFRYSQK